MTEVENQNIIDKPKDLLNKKELEWSENKNSVDVLRQEDSLELTEKILSGEEGITPENLRKLSFAELMRLENTLADTGKKAEIQQFMFANYSQQLFENASQSINNPAGDTEGGNAVKNIGNYLSPALEAMGQFYGQIGEKLSHNPENMNKIEKAQVAQFSSEVSWMEIYARQVQDQINQIV